MGYHYDPILCMNVPDSASKAKDADMFVQLRFSSGKTEGAKLDPNEFREYAEALLNKYKEKQVTISKNGKVLATYINRNVRDVSLVGMRDASDRDKRALENIKNMVKNIQRSSDVLHDFIVIKNTANQIQDKTLKAEAMKIVNSMASKIRGAGSRDSKVIDDAIRTADKFTVWESDEYDDIYVSYEGGTYVLYVENRPQADGPQQRMIQLAKQEERMRG